MFPEHMIRTVVPIFSLIGLGYVSRWRGLLRGGDERVLSTYIYYFGLPSLIIVDLAGIVLDLDALRFIGVSLVPLVVVFVLSSPEIYVSKPIFGASTTHCDDDNGSTTFYYNSIETIGFESRYLENDGEHDHDAPGTWTLTKSAGWLAWFELDVPLLEWEISDEAFTAELNLRNTLFQTVSYDYVWNAYTHYRWDYISDDRCLLAFHDMDA